MQTPPPYSSPQPRRSSTGLIIAIVLGSCALCCLLLIGGAVGGGFFMFNKSKPMLTCVMAFDDLRKSVQAYAKDHGGKLPDADKWQTEVLPYYRKKSATHKPEEASMFGIMPADGVWGCDTPKARTGIAFNSDLSGKKISDIEDPDTTVMLFEVDSASMNAHQPYKRRPPKSGPQFIMGEPRPWIEVTVSGVTNMNGGKGSSMMFDTDSNGGLRMKSRE